MKANLSSNKVTATMLAQLPFIGEAMPIIAFPKDTVELYNMYSVTDEDLPKIHKLLTGGDMPTVAKKSRAYILPNCMYTQVQFREICKMHGITITHDISRADLFIGNENNILKHINYEPAQTLGTEKIDLKHYYINTDFDIAAIQAKFLQFPDLETSIGSKVLFTNRYYNYKDSWGPLYATDHTYNIVSGECVEILHRILSAGIPVVNEQKLFNSIERVTIDEDVYNTLHIMFENAGNEDRMLAAEMLFNCDYDKSRHYIVKLIKEHSYRIESAMSRKNLEIFKKSFDITKISRYNYRETLKYLLQNNALTEENYMDILYDEVKESTKYFKDQLDKLKNFFGVDIMITMSYQDYINENTPKNEENKSIPSQDGSPF
jgi:hypothetical protein